MKVIIINQHYTDALGGSEIQCDLIACGLTKLGHEVIYCAVGNKRRSNYNGSIYKIIPISIEQKGELLKLLSKEKADVIYWRYNKHYLRKVLHQSKRIKVPFLFAVSNIGDVNWFKRKTNKSKNLIQEVKNIVVYGINLFKSIWNYQAFKDINALTTLNSEYINKTPVKKQRVIWNSFEPISEDFTWKKPFCVWVANIKERKQPEKYIELAQSLSFQLPEIDFLMIGKIQDKSYKLILEEAEEKIENFHYLGFKSPEYVNGVLKEAKCLLHTCMAEGFGNIFIQAWLQGCPTVSLEFDPDGCIKKEKLGFVSGSINQMIKDVRLLLTNKTLRNEFGVKAISFAQKNFSVDRMVIEVELYLREVIDEYRNNNQL